MYGLSVTQNHVVYILLSFVLINWLSESESDWSLSILTNIMIIVSMIFMFFGFRLIISNNCLSCQCHSSFSPV